MLNEMERVAISHQLSNNLNEVVKLCKEEVDMFLKDNNIAEMINKSKDIVLDTQYEIEDKVCCVKLYDKNENFLGNFLKMNDKFFHLKSTNRDKVDESDKIEYEIFKRHFEINNFNTINITESSIKKLETKAKKDENINNFKNIIEELINSSNTKKDYSYRLNIPKDENLITAKNIDEALSFLVNERNKMKISFFGASLYEKLGVKTPEKEIDLNVNISCKDKLLNILRDSSNIRSKDELKAYIESLSFNEKMQLLEIADSFQKLCDNFTKSKSDYKDNSIYYKKSTTYIINKEDLEKNLDETIDLKSLLKSELDFITLKCDKKYEYTKMKNEKSYFIKNISFDNFENQKIQEYLLKERENKEMLERMTANLPQKHSYNYKHKLKMTMKK